MSVSSWHAVRYPIQPGSEESVARLFRASVLPPDELTAGEGEQATRLLGTMVFVGNGTALRLIEFDGELPAVIAHLASRPEARAFQAELAKYLQTDHDLRGPGIGAFFRDATLRQVPVGSATDG
jgi:hypothetical protein